MEKKQIMKDVHATAGKLSELIYSQSDVNRYFEKDEINTLNYLIFMIRSDYPVMNRENLTMMK